MVLELKCKETLLITNASIHTLFYKVRIIIVTQTVELMKMELRLGTLIVTTIVIVLVKIPKPLTTKTSLLAIIMELLTMVKINIIQTAINLQ